jgi:hypothetical protein
MAGMLANGVECALSFALIRSFQFTFEETRLLSREVV